MKKIMNKIPLEGGLRKILLIMRLKIFILFCCIGTANANTFSQERIDVIFNNESITSVFDYLKKNTDYEFVYRKDILSETKPVSIDMKNVTVEEIMDAVLLKNGFTYEMVAHVVVIKKDAQQQQKPQTMIVSGRVTDAKGETLPGVNVVIKGTTTGVVTDIDGHFQLSVPKTEKLILVFSFVGMKPKEMQVTDGKPLSVVLESTAQEMEEVVVTGYQKIDRKLFTGSATYVSAEKAVIEGVTDVGRMLQGKAAGVQVQNVSGTFGASPKIRVRGSSSIYGNSNPLWVVDGVVLEDVVEISADDLASGNAVTLIGSAVAGLNANDIESFQILKDASATALYGARAMNGVVIITTKKGRSGQIRVNYSLEMTMKMKPSYETYDILNSQEQMGVYLDMQDKGLLNHSSMARVASGGVYAKMYDLINTFNPKTGKFGLENTVAAKNAYLRKAELRNTDWFDVLFQNKVQHNHSLSLAGGTDKASFYASVSYLNDPGWTISDKVDRFTANLNSTIKLGQCVDLNITTNNSLRRQRVPGALDREMDVVSGEYNRNFDINPFSYALNASRTMTPRQENGELEFYKMNHAPFNILNEAQYNYIDIDYLDSKIQAELGINPMKGLSLRALGALRYVKTTREHKIHENSNLANSYRAAEDATIRENNKFLYQDPDNPAALPDVVLPSGGFYNRDDNTLLNYYFRATAAFNDVFKDKHNVNVMVGHETKYADRTSAYSRGYGYQWGKGGVPFVDYRILRQILDGGFQYYGMNKNYDRFVAFFLTSGYSYDERYTINVTGRYDGSNRLGRSKSARWLPTWNISGAWHVGSEAFMRDQSVFSTLNLRATYGLTASMGPASNAMAIYRNEIAFRPTQSEKENQISLVDLENSDLTWEKQYETNVGLDMGFIENRISLSTDVYSRKGFDLIGIVTTTGIGGQSRKAANYADMESWGVEATLNTRNVIVKDFSWTSNLTFSYNKNEITNLGSNPSAIELIREEGGALEGYPVKGLFSIPFVGLNSEGAPLLIDSDGSVTETGVFFQGKNVDYLKYEGPIDPKVVGGFENTFKYKGLSLSVYLTYQAGNKIRLYPGFKSSYSDIQSMSKDMADRWMVAGDEYRTNIPGIPSLRQLRENTYLSQSYNSYNYSDVRVADGGFLRLKDIVLSYSFPKSILDKIKMNDLQLKLSASNVCLLYSDKKLNGQDPEFFRAGGVAMPMPRQFTFSLKVGF